MQLSPAEFTAQTLITNSVPYNKFSNVYDGVPRKVLALSTTSKVVANLKTTL